MTFHKHLIVAVMAGLFSVGLGAGLAHAGEPNTLSDQEKKDGWKLLFDGKSLDGWNSWKTKQPLEAGMWQVKDGALTLTGKGGGDVYTAEPYENFEFVVEWKTTGNSGIFIRVDPSVKGAIYSVAPEVQVMPDNANDTKSTSGGGLYALYDMTVKEKKIDPKGWNEMRIKIVDGHGEHWFNGDKIADYQIGSEDWKKTVLNSKFKKAVDTFGMNANGHLGFQDHGHAVQFRNIKIRELPSAK